MWKALLLRSNYSALRVNKKKTSSITSINTYFFNIEKKKLKLNKCYISRCCKLYLQYICIKMNRMLELHKDCFIIECLNFYYVYIAFYYITS